MSVTGLSRTHDPTSDWSTFGEGPVESSPQPAWVNTTMITASSARVSMFVGMEIGSSLGWAHTGSIRQLFDYRAYHNRVPQPRRVQSYRDGQLIASDGARTLA